MNIVLSEKTGVNPSLTMCPICSKDTNELLLLGKQSEYECNCGQRIIGKNKNAQCPSCDALSHNWKYIGEYEATHSSRLPASEPCDDCKKMLEGIDKEIEKGGVPWRCVDCKSEGVIKHNHPFAKEFNEKHPGHGYEMTKDKCPVCRGEI